jgi:hypothetical protein
MTPDALDATNTEHRQPVVVLQSSKLALDGGAATVEPSPLVNLAQDARRTMPTVSAKRDDSICRAAIGAMREMAAQSDGYHRIPIPDYLIGACAQDAGIGVLHYDHDFDRLAEVMGFESRWAADPPALD